MLQLQTHLFQGVSFLEVKNDVLLAYMIDVSLLMQRKVYGKSIQGHPALQRLVENRVVSIACHCMRTCKYVNGYGNYSKKDAMYCWPYVNVNVTKE